MQLSPLTAIAPIDGRYYSQTSVLSNYFSEYAFIKFRLYIEVQYFIFLSEKKFFHLSSSVKKDLLQFVKDFTIEQAETVKKIEASTNHDVKAVEYFLKQQLETFGIENEKEWVHFGLTSQDINNTAIPFLWKRYVQFEYLPAVVALKDYLLQLAKEWKDIPMLARTHGQPASPTKLGKELMVFVERLNHQLQLFSQIPYAAKFGGASGNFNAHHVAFPSTNWIQLANEFVEEILGLQRLQFTTQIEHYDFLAAQFQILKNIHQILLNLCRDIWMYIGMEYFNQKIKEGEIGSSTMPHKINPIDFENAEGNLGIANALLEHLASKLPVSRLQRDLSDSTVIRNLGVPMAHGFLSIRSIEKGLNKLVLNKEKIEDDLNEHWAVIAEAIQTILRREHYDQPYEDLKKLTRGHKHITKEELHKFIDSLSVNENVKKEMKAITPENYTGVQPDY